MHICPCLIRCNTPEIRNHLEYLGYQEWSVYDDEPILVVGNFNFKAQSAQEPDILSPIVISINDDEIDDFTSTGYIDCGTNVDLFFALAALRDDTDTEQWFVYRGSQQLDNREIWKKSLVDKWQHRLPYFKATSEDLIKHFLPEV